MTDKPEFDVTWEHPTELQIAALEHVHRCYGKKPADLKKVNHHLMVLMEAERKVYASEANVPYGLSEYDMAEIIIMARWSLWYTQCEAWAKGDTPMKNILPPGMAIAFENTGAALKLIADRGYQDGQWWALERIWEDPKKLAAVMLGVLYTIALMPTLAFSGYVFAPSFKYLPRLLIPKLDVQRAMQLVLGQENWQVVAYEIRALYDKEWAKKLAKAKREARAETARTYEPTKCICPECENLVAPPGIKPRAGHFKNYRNIGACCRDHAGYVCLHPTCQAKAEALGYTDGYKHRYGDKIAVQHLEFRKKE